DRPGGSGYSKSRARELDVRSAVVRILEEVDHLLRIDPDGAEKTGVERHERAADRWAADRFGRSIARRQRQRHESEHRDAERGPSSTRESAADRSSPRSRAREAPPAAQGQGRHQRASAVKIGRAKM